MPSSPPQTTLPTPVSAYLGLLATAVDGTKAAVRTAPLRAVQLPLKLAADVVSLRAHVLGRYAELAERGDEVVARFRGEAPAAPTPPAAAYADELAAVTTSAADRWHAAGPDEPTNGQSDWAGLSGVDAGGAAATALGVAPLGDAEPRDLQDDAAAALAETPAVPAQTGPAAAADDNPAIDPAPAEPALTPTMLPAAVDPAVTGIPVPDSDALPLPDFDHMTLGSLRGRLRRLDVGSLEQLVAYEQAHGKRLAILTMLENRIEKLRADGEG